MNSKYRVLYGKLKEKRMTYANVAEIIDCSETSVKNKMNGKTNFSISEAIKLRDVVSPEMSIDDLFVVDNGSA